MPEKMIEPQRRAYLEALGLDVWVTRPAAPERDRLVISPGRSSTLLVCDSADQSVTKLAGDIGRALGGSPVWAWPDPEGGQDSPSLEEAVVSRSLAQVILFGAGLSTQMFNGKAPDELESAAIYVTSSLDDLAVGAPARKALWELVKDRREESH